jgi:hypothetical protein
MQWFNDRKRQFKNIKGSDFSEPFVVTSDIMDPGLRRDDMDGF